MAAASLDEALCDLARLLASRFIPIQSHEPLAVFRAFSRDHAIPGWRMWTRLNHHRVPAYAVVFACACALVMTLPALWGDQNGVAYAFLAVVSIP